jgi:hypothetical protein
MLNHPPASLNRIHNLLLLRPPLMSHKLERKAQKQAKAKAKYKAKKPSSPLLSLSHQHRPLEVSL